MIPLRDHQKTYKTPVITYALIALNIIVFFAELGNVDYFISNFALIPANIDFSNASTLITFISSQFLHVGFLHIISNMWFLKIFGDNVEEKFGSGIFLIIYILSGIGGGLLQYVFSPQSNIPMLGASGAVAGVLGAYLVFFPKHSIETIIPFGLFTRIMNLPASVILIYWLVIQIFSGFGSIAIAQVGGVAWFAHIGGFVIGYFAARVYKDRRKGEELFFEGYDYVN